MYNKKRRNISSLYNKPQKKQGFNLAKVECHLERSETKSKDPSSDSSTSQILPIIEFATLRMTKGAILKI